MKTKTVRSVDVIQVAAHLTGKDPFNRNDAPEILKGALQVAGPLSALRAVNLQGQGSFVGPNVELPAIDLEFRRGFESARDGARYVGSPFDAGDLGAVAVLAAPVEDAPGSRIGVVEALVSWQPVAREFSDEARREVRATLVDGRGRILFPLGKEQGHAHPRGLHRPLRAASGIGQGAVEQQSVLEPVEQRRHPGRRAALAAPATSG